MSKISIILIVIIAAIAILQSFFSYQYFTFASQEILSIASQEIRSNADGRGATFYFTLPIAPQN